MVHRARVVGRLPGRVGEEQKHGAYDLGQLYSQCYEFFRPSDFSVSVNADANTVWIHCPKTRRAFGVQPWQLERHDLESLLSKAEKKLRGASAPS